MSISAINLGSSFTNLNGSTSVSGLGSGLNDASVINGIVSAQSSQITPLKDQISLNNNQDSALLTLQQLLTAIQTAASTIASPQSPDSTNNLWAVNTSNITSNTNQAASNYLTATVASGTPSGTYTITNIQSIATASTQVLATTVSSATAAVVVASGADGTSGKEFNAGTYTVGGGSVTLTANMSLSDVAAAFNASSSTTGITATVVQTSVGKYTIGFTSTTTGASTAFNLNSTGFNSSSTSFGTPISGTDAVFNLNGVQVDRPTNTISDLISGVTFSVLQDTTAQTGASFTLSIQPDVNNIAAGIQGFATAYNNFLAFYAQQTQLNSSGTPASSATLYSDSTLRSIYNEVTNEASSIIGGITGNTNSLASVGISFANTPASGTSPEVDNTLSIDNATLLTALQSNLTGVEKVFGAYLTSSDSNLALFQSPTSNDGVTSFTLNVDPSGTSTLTYTDPATGNSNTVNLTSTSLGSTGVTLSIPAGNGPLSGLQMIYSSSASNSNITVNLSQGVADQISSTAGNAIYANTGLIAEDITALATKNTTINAQITLIQSQVASTRQQLTAKYAALEAAIAQANSSLNLLNAQQSASSSG
jgi:flagellar hook-associated protein 2